MSESITIHNLRRCAGPECGRPFATCRSCGWTRRYCSSSCRDETRRRRVREAGHRYQQSILGRQAHAARQARYRERQRVADAAGWRPVSHDGRRRPERDGEERCPGVRVVSDEGPVERDLASTLAPEAARARAVGHEGDWPEPAGCGLTSTLCPEAACAGALGDEGNQPASAECDLASTLAPEAACVRAESEGGSRPGDFVSLPPETVTHHSADWAPRHDGREEPSGRPMVPSRGMSEALERHIPPVPLCAFCGRGDHRTFMNVQDGPPPDPARLGRRFRWGGAREPARSELRVL